MKVTTMKCPNCGAGVKLHGEGVVQCDYCGQVFYTESEKAPEVRDTLIDDYENEKDKPIKEPTPLQDAISGIMIILLMFTPIFSLLFVSGAFEPKETFSADNPYKDNPDKRWARNYEEHKKFIEENGFLIDRYADKSETESAKETEVTTEEETKFIERDWLEVGADESDIRYIGYMEDLNTLIIHDASNITDYSALEGAYRITRLTIRNAKSLKNVDFLSSMRDLEYLDIEGSPISDLSVLKKNRSLKYLTLENNENVSDYTFLKNLKSLKKLKLSTALDAKIPDLSKHKFSRGLTINGKIYN